MDYKISSRAYLLRAKAQLAEGTLSGLFYAAFELRCGIEARMCEYLEAWDHISEKKKKGWRIAELSKNIEKMFRSGNKVVRLAIHDMKTGNLIKCFYYTPVTDELKKAGEKIGNYLHSMKKYEPIENSYWTDLRKELENASGQLEMANKGTLLGPPLMKAGTNKINMIHEIISDKEIEPLKQKMLDKNIIMKVSYLDNLPSDMEEQVHTWNSKA